MPSPLQRLLFFLLVATTVWSAAMSIEASRIALPDEEAREDCRSSGNSILGIELAPSPACFTAVVKQVRPDRVAGNSKLIGANTYMDFVLIALYWSVFVLFGRLEASRWINWVSSFISLAALFDVLEDSRILRGLAVLS